MMSRLFRTAIVGLGRSDVMILRDAFQAVCDAHRFEWVNADNSQIDLLVVNSFFINSSGVQRIIQQQAMPCLIVEHQLKTPSVEDDHLYLPLQEISSLKHWLSTSLLGRPVQAESTPPAQPLINRDMLPVDEKQQDKSSEAKADTAHSPIHRSQPSVAPSDPGHQGSLNQTIRRIVDTRTGIWEVADQAHVLAIADCVNQLIWHPKTDQQESHQLRLPLSLNKIYQIPQSYVPADLKQWLWQLAWTSENEQSFLPKNLPVQLKAWPQPCGSMAVQPLLAACAYLKNKAASAESLSGQLNMPLQDAQRLVSSLVAVKFAIETKISTAIVASATPVNEEPEQEEVSFFKGFLSKLRNKLGL